MVELSAELVKLAEPIEAGNPCGESLDDTQALAALESYRVFGRLKASTEEPDWTALRKACLEALARSKDLRVLAHLAAVALQTHSLAAALRLFALTATWLERYWDEVYPRIDEDAIARRNALLFCADRVAMVEALRRVAVVKDPQLGALSVRDFEIASGTLAATESEPKRALSDINTALSQAQRPVLTELAALAVSAIKAVQQIEAMMLERGGSAAIPQLDPLLQVLQRLQQMLAPYTASIETSSDSPEQIAAEAVRDVGKIASRDDVVRAFDAIMSYYRNHEPGSLVPVITERAKRLVSVSFLDALAEIAPEVVDPVKKAVGVREKSP